jgi:citrate lyase beta subunit
MAQASRILGSDYTEAQSVHPGLYSPAIEFQTSVQPLHTLYGGAHLFKQDTIQKLSEVIRRYTRTYLKSPESIQILLHLALPAEEETISRPLIEELFTLISRKIEGSAIEDYRIDFEDGYGYHTDAEEDATAVSAAREAAAAFLQGTLPPFVGFRVKSFSGHSRKRALNTLDIFLSEFLEASGGKLPSDFAITLPKIESLEEIESFNETIAEIEYRAGLKKESLQTELMIEEPGLLIAKTGASLLPQILSIAGSRCAGLHIGIYDYLSALQVPASFQSYMHPLVIDLRTKLLIASHASPIHIVDGVTNILPVEIHRGKELTADAFDENMGAVYAGWSAHIRHVTHSLEFGIYQGWDIHPAQVIARYIAVYKHLLMAKQETLDRMKRFMTIATKPNQSGGIFDDAATVRGLLVSLRRMNALGIVSDEEILSAGLTKEQLQSNKILLRGNEL